jgi:hypothetical protein
MKIKIKNHKMGRPLTELGNRKIDWANTTNRQLAELLGVTYPTAWALRKRLGVEPLPRGRVPTN